MVPSGRLANRGNETELGRFQLKIEKGPNYAIFENPK